MVLCRRKQAVLYYSVILTMRAPRSTHRMDGLRTEALKHKTTPPFFDFRLPSFSVILGYPSRSVSSGVLLLVVGIGKGSKKPTTCSRQGTGAFPRVVHQTIAAGHWNPSSCILTLHKNISRYVRSPYSYSLAVGTYMEWVGMIGSIDP